MGDILLNKDRIAGENNSQFSYRVLRWNIMSLNLKPGQVISEPELTAELCISRTPIREAIFRLREEHLIDVFSQNKTRVSFIDYNLVQEALLIRAAVESAVLQKLAGRLNEKDRLYLLENLNRQQFIAENDELRTSFFELDNAFHKLLFTAADCCLAWETIRKVSSHLDRVRYFHLHDVSSPPGIKKLYLDHQRLLSLVVEGRADEIPATVRAHVTARPSTIWDWPENQLSRYFINVPKRTTAQ